MKESASDSNMMMMTYVKLNVRQGLQVTYAKILTLESILRQKY